MSSLHVLRSSTNVMGTGSVAFGFKRYHDAVACVRRMRSMGPMVKIWYTAIKPDKFVLTTAPQRAHDPTLDKFEIHTIDMNEFLQEMMDSNLAVRLIDEVDVDHELTTLHSQTGYEPYYSHEEKVVLLERILLRHLFQDGDPQAPPS